MTKFGDLFNIEGNLKKLGSFARDFIDKKNNTEFGKKVQTMTTNKPDFLPNLLKGTVDIIKQGYDKN